MCNISIQITHLCDFKYWEIFRGLTVEQIREREESFDYPPRLQIKCEQIDASKPLYSSFEVFKSTKSKEVLIARFSLVKKVTGTYIHACIIFTLRSKLVIHNVTIKYLIHGS